MVEKQTTPEEINFQNYSKNSFILFRICL